MQRALRAAVISALALSAACRDQAQPREPAAPAAALAPSPTRIDLRLWTRMDPAELGCWMERSLGHRDPRWNCSLSRYENDADACDDPARFSEGPAFPAALAPRLHPLLTGVALAWEGGALQRIAFTFGRDLAPAEMARAVGADDRSLADVASAGRGECASPCYVVTVFDSQADECDDDEEDPDG
jgi:hypothetical protein